MTTPMQLLITPTQRRGSRARAKRVRNMEPMAGMPELCVGVLQTPMMAIIVGVQFRRFSASIGNCFQRHRALAGNFKMHVLDQFVIATPPFRQIGLGIPN